LIDLDKVNEPQNDSSTLVISKKLPQQPKPSLLPNTAHKLPPTAASFARRTLPKVDLNEYDKVELKR